SRRRSNTPTSCEAVDRSSICSLRPCGRILRASPSSLTCCRRRTTPLRSETRHPACTSSAEAPIARKHRGYDSESLSSGTLVPAAHKPEDTCGTTRRSGCSEPSYAPTLPRCAPPERHPGIPRRDRMRYSDILRAASWSFQIKDFFHHLETLPWSGGKRFEEMAHELLPALIHRVAVELIPGAVEIVYAQGQEQILIAAKDRIVRDADLFQLRQHLR